MRKITALLLLFFLVSSSFIMFLPPISGQEVVSTEDGFTRVEDFVAGASDTQWQKDTQFTANSEISVNGGDMVLDFDHESWQWNTMTYSNGTWVIHETRNVWGFGYIQYACNNNLEHVIKCWLRGDVSLPTDYRIGVSRGTWNPETNIYQSYNQKYSFNLTDVADYGFPITYDADTSQLVIGVSGTFDIDPTITQDAETANRMRNDVVVTLGHFDYVFYKSGNWLQYMYKNSSISAWNNGSKIWATNRTEYTDMPQGVYDTGADGKFPHSWKSNGTHIYGAVASKKYSDGHMGRFFLFNVSTIGSIANVTHNYDIGSLVLHTNASIPCLGDAQYASNCGNWSQELGECNTSCFIDVNMNSTGFPMVMYSTDRSLGQGDSAGFSPAVMIAVAENPVGATCTEKSDFSQRPCNQNDARNGKNGTWTQPYQVDSIAKRIPGGSGHRYIWYTDSHNDHAGTSSSNMYQWEGNMCSMGNGNMFMMWHNRTGSTNEGSVWGRFWYQTNATWGSEFAIFSAPGSDWMYYMDNIDLTCTPAKNGTMTAHIAFTVFKNIGELNRKGWVLYTNLTDARVNTVTSLDPCETMNGNGIYNIWCIRHFDHNTWALDVQVTSDNSTGAVGVFYFTNRGDVFYNITGSHGNGGFSKNKAMHSQGLCGLSGSSFIISTQWERNHMSMPMFMNGTVLDDSAGAMMVFSCQDDSLVPTITGDSTILYQHYLNASVTANLIFYDQEGTPVTITNMTFLSHYNGTTLSVASCSTCYTALKTGTYSVQGIFRGNADMDINGTGASPTFYIDLANTTASFVVGNMSVTFTFLDETTLDVWDVSAKPVKIDIWTTTNTKMNQTIIDETGDLQIFTSNTPARIKVTFGDTYQYYRWDAEPNGCNTEGCNTDITFYLPDYTSHTVQGYTWNFADQTQQYTNGTVLFRKYVSTGLIQIDHPALSVPTNHVVFYGILNHEYTISVFAKNNIRRSDIGIWTAEASPTTIEANIIASPLFNNIPLTQNYVLFQARRTICTAEDIANIRNQCSGAAFGGSAHSNITIYWKDIKNETSTVTFEIFNRTGLQYSTTLTGNPAETIILWQGADTNISHTYWVKMTASSSRFGSIVETRPATQAGGEFGPIIPIGRCTVVCDGGLLDNFSPYYVYISMTILIFTIGLFSQATASIGAIITAAVADMLYFFGWLPGMSPLIPATATLLSIIYLLAVARSRR